MHDVKPQVSLAEMLNDSSIDRVMAIDPDKKIISWNKTSETMTGLRRSDVLGRHLLDAFPEIGNDTPYLHALETALKGLKSFLPSDRQTVHRQFIELHVIPLVNDAKEIAGVMMIAHDVSHRIKAEQQLQLLNQQLEKKYRELERASNELSTFTIITSTNIKEPVRHLYTGLEFLVKSEGRNLSDAGKASMRRMQSSLNRMNLLLNDILTFSQINNPDTTPGVADLRTVMEEVKTQLQSRIEDTAATIHLTGEWPTLVGHAQLVELLLYHLTDNAVKFQPAGQSPVITIDVSRSSLSGDRMPGEYIRIAVTDNGIGFLASDATRIFSLFEKLHGHDYRGSGMGLAIARKIMELHDGFILTQSKPGEGSVFECYFPVNP